MRGGPVIRIGIAEDHPLSRRALVQLFEAEEDLEVVGAACDGSEALELVHDGREPDVLLLDVRLPDLDGIEVARKILEERPGLAILMLSAHDDHEYVAEAMRVGARGYVLKTAEANELVQAVHLVARGHLVMDSKVSGILGEKRAQEQEPAPKTGPLTERELQVLRQLAEGRTNRAIAKRLGISPETVKAHLERIFRKLGAGDRTDAVAQALRSGLID